MAKPCNNDPNEVIESVLNIQSAEKSFEAALSRISAAANGNADKLDNFVNGGVSDSVQLGTGTPTPSIRNTVHQMLSAAALIPNADVSGKSVVASSGSGSTARTLAERFADIVNVRDFGAVGDGSTDDTAAFQATAATGRRVFVPQGTYNVTQTVDGSFFSLESAAVPFVRVENLALPIVHFSEWHASPMSLGFDRVGDGLNRILGVDTYEPRQWERASQHGCCDVWDSVVYIPGENAAHRTFLKAIRWTENEAERELLAESQHTFGVVPHQSLAVYRPTRNHTPIFFGFDSGYRAEDDYDISRRGTLNLFTFDYRTGGEPVLVKTYDVFNVADGFDLGFMNNCAISPDSSRLVCCGVKNGQRTFRVFDLHAIMLNKITNLRTEYINSFYFSDASGAGQGIATDGENVYALTATGQQPSNNVSDGVITAIPITATGLVSNPVYSNFDVISGIGVDLPTYRAEAEFEGLLFCPLNNKISPILETTFAYHDDESNPDDFKRFNRYQDASRPSTLGQPTGRHLYVMGDILFKGNAAKSDGTNIIEQTIIRQVPVLNNIVPVFGCGQSVVVGAGECANNSRYAFINARDNTEYGGGENLHLLADSAVYISGANDTYNADTLPLYSVRNNSDTLDSNQWSGLCVANTNKVYISGTDPMLGVNNWDINPGNSVQNNITMSMRFIGGGHTNSGNNLLGGMFYYAETNGNCGIRFNLVDYSNEDRTNKQLLALQWDHSSWKFRVNVYANFVPGQNNQHSLGESGSAFSNVYVASGAINGSDERIKQDIKEIPDEVLDAFESVSLLMYRFKDAVLQKGDTARIHIGAVAQRIKEAFEKHGVDPFKYGLFCYDEWEDQYQEVEIVDKDEVVDSEGHVLQKEEKHYERKKVKEAGNMYSLRYGELLCLEAACQRRRADRLEARIAELEARLNKISGNSSAPSGA